jgi:hypothetical protein
MTDKILLGLVFVITLWTAEVNQKCSKLSQTVSMCLKKCPKVPKNCPKLPKTAQNCPKLPKTAQNCPKLPKDLVFSSVCKVITFWTKKASPQSPHSATKCHRVLQSATECHRVPQSATECHKMPQSGN